MRRSSKAGWPTKALFLPAFATPRTARCGSPVGRLTRVLFASAVIAARPGTFTSCRARVTGKPSICLLPYAHCWVRARPGARAAFSLGADLQARWNARLSPQARGAHSLASVPQGVAPPGEAAAAKLQGELLVLQDQAPGRVGIAHPTR